MLSINHAHAVYKHAQEIIKFIDTKTSFVSGACVATLGFILQLVKQAVDNPNPINAIAAVTAHPICSYVMRYSVLGAILFGVICLLFCVASLVGRPPHANTRTTILFPFYVGTDLEKECCGRISKVMSQEDIASEYETQIWNVGSILRIKIIRHRTAVWMFWCQIILLCIAGASLLLAIL